MIVRINMIMISIINIIMVTIIIIIITSYKTKAKCNVRLAVVCIKRGKLLIYESTWAQSACKHMAREGYPSFPRFWGKGPGVSLVLGGN